MDIIEQNLDQPWDFKYVSLNPNLTFEFIQKYRNKFILWWDFISEHKCITWEHIQNHPELFWSCYGIFCNPNITMDIVEQYFDKKWKNCFIDTNINLTFEFVLKHQDKFDKNVLFNQFQLEKEKIYNKYITPYIIRIQRWWRKYYYSVEFAKKDFEKNFKFQ
jgi:hypothetical protein